jgi:hypothetical protein
VVGFPLVGTPTLVLALVTGRAGGGREPEVDVAEVSPDRLLGVKEVSAFVDWLSGARGVSSISVDWLSGAAGAFPD